MDKKQIAIKNLSRDLQFFLSTSPLINGRNNLVIANISQVY
jgi:hypothetical protein